MKILAIWNEPELETAVAFWFLLAWPETTVRSTTQAGRGVDFLVTDSLDMILLDPLLPDANGFEILSLIRSLSDVPVVLVSATDVETDVVRCLDLGADDYVVKPVSSDHLVARIEAVLRRVAADDLGPFAVLKNSAPSGSLWHEIATPGGEDVGLFEPYHPHCYCCCCLN